MSFRAIGCAGPCGRSRCAWRAGAWASADFSARCGSICALSICAARAWRKFELRLPNRWRGGQRSAGWLRGKQRTENPPCPMHPLASRVAPTVAGNRRPARAVRRSRPAGDCAPARLTARATAASDRASARGWRSWIAKPTEYPHTYQAVRGVGRREVFAGLPASEPPGAALSASPTVQLLLFKFPPGTGRRGSTKRSSSAAR
jgi:hypothetical protein